MENNLSSFNGLVGKTDSEFVDLEPRNLPLISIKHSDVVFDTGDLLWRQLKFGSMYNTGFRSTLQRVEKRLGGRIVMLNGGTLGSDISGDYEEFLVTLVIIGKKKTYTHRWEISVPVTHLPGGVSSDEVQDVLLITQVWQDSIWKQSKKSKELIPLVEGFGTSLHENMMSVVQEMIFEYESKDKENPK